MMKHEFENAIGKEVDTDVFEAYNAMYMALPVRYTKQDFFAMINADAVPEAQSAIERRQEREKLISRWQDEIKSVKQEISECKQYLKNERDALEIWKNDGDKEMQRYIRSNIAYWKKRIAEKQALIHEYEWMINA